MIAYHVGLDLTSKNGVLDLIKTVRPLAPFRAHGSPFAGRSRRSLLHGQEKKSVRSCRRFCTAAPTLAITSRLGCAQAHLVNPKTGKVLGSDDE